MDKTVEYWDLYDRNIQKTGEVIQRGKTVPEGKYHLVCDIAVIDNMGRILLTKRHPDKPYPLYWECSGGSVVTGEMPIDGAVRELFEETGIKAEKEELTELGITYGNHAIYFNYLLRRDIELSSLVLQSDETVDAKLADKAEYERMVNENLIVPLVAGRFSELGVDKLLK
ncbi:MAG: NUDIX domain-containing protein [Ruminococcaceae bacterium]|nr:NUDIX domain-containing protein [Oscillospiraceae bacterium]